MPRTKRTHVVCVFQTREQAHHAVEALRQAGFSSGQIAVVMHHDKPHHDIAITNMDAAQAARVTGQTKAREDAAKGAALGGLFGVIAGATLGLLIPGIGPIIGIGTLAGTLFGLAAGAAGGGVVGALVGLEFPEEEAKFYERELKAGRVLVGVHAGARNPEAREIMTRDGGTEPPLPQPPAPAAPAAVAAGATATPLPPAP